MTAPDLTATQRVSFDVARARLATAQAAYDKAPTPVNFAKLETAQNVYRKLQVPMMNAALSEYYGEAQQ